jgi:flagellar hook-basal body complex protein FliE
MITMEKADISLRLMVQMRNKVVEAYQEIMRMQV